MATCEPSSYTGPDSLLPRQRSLGTSATRQPHHSPTAQSKGEPTEPKIISIPYAGRLGGNQVYILDPSNPSNAQTLKQHPDASPWMSISTLLSLHGFLSIGLWKAALIEGIGSMMLIYLTLILNASPSLDIQPLPSANGSPAGIFGTAVFFGPLIGAVGNVVFLSLFIFSFGAVSGAHLNPLITIATFFCRLTTFPRLVLYIGLQSLGGVLAGLLIRASMNSTHFKIGGCWQDPLLVTTGQAFTIEFISCLTLIFLATGVGLDPRQAQIYGPAFAPILVGFSVGMISLSTAFTVPGYGGAGINPARCLAAWMGSDGGLGVAGVNLELGYQAKNGDGLWVYWIAALAASILHCVFYGAVPPWGIEGRESPRNDASNDKRGKDQV